MAPLKSHKANLTMLMSFKYGQEFTSDREFTDAELQALTPNDIYQYFKFRVQDKRQNSEHT